MIYFLILRCVTPPKKSCFPLPQSIILFSYFPFYPPPPAIPPPRYPQLQLRKNVRLVRLWLLPHLRPERGCQEQRQQQERGEELQDLGRRNCQSQKVPHQAAIHEVNQRPRIQKGGNTSRKIRWSKNKKCVSVLCLLYYTTLTGKHLYFFLSNLTLQDNLVLLLYGINCAWACRILM